MGKIGDIIRQVRGSRDGRVLAKNLWYMSLLQVANGVFPFVTMPYLAKVLGVDGFGKVAFAAAIIVWVQTITDWGFNYSATREVSLHKEDKSRLSQIFNNVMWAKVALMLLTALALAALTVAVPKFREHALLIGVTFLLVPGHVMFPEWLFQGLERMKYITILNVVAKALFTVAVFLFVKEKGDYWLQPLLSSVGYLVAGTTAMALVWKKFGLRMGLPRWTEVGKTIKGSTDIFINNLMPNLYNSLTTVTLNLFSGDVRTGYYSSGKNLTAISNVLLNTITRVFFPYLSRKQDYHSIYAQVNIGLSVVVAAALAIGAPLWIKILYPDADFANAVLILRITSVAVVFNTLNNVYGQNYLLVKHKDRLLRNIVIVSSLVGFALSVPLISKWSYIGAAVVYVTSTVLIGVLPMVAALRLKRKEARQ